MATRSHASSALCAATRGALGERLRGEVDRERPCGGALTRHRGDGGIVPARLVVIARRRGFLAHRRHRGGEDDPPHASAVLQRGVQDRRGPSQSDVPSGSIAL